MSQPNPYDQQQAATLQHPPQAQPQATDSFATTPTDIKIVSQNVQGLKNEEKLEYLARIISKHHIKAYLIQETHLAGDFTMQISGGHTIIHHGPDSQPTSGAKGGVAIILCPEWYHYWQKSGSIQKRIPAADTARLLAIELKIPTQNCKNKEKRNKVITLVTSYHPHSGYTDEETDFFNQQIADLYTSIPDNNIVIMGADINASIGSRTSNNNERDNNPNIEETIALSPQDLLIGPCANPRINHKGHLYIDLLSQLDLRAASTYFQNESGYDTWINPATQEKYQLDHFLIPRKHFKLVKNVKKTFYGTTSDHLAIQISLNLTKGKYKNFTPAKTKSRYRIDNTILRGDGKSSFQTKVCDFLKLKNSPTPDTFEEFEIFLVEAAKQCAEIEIVARKDWFADNELELLLKIEIRNRTQKKYDQETSAENRTLLQAARKNLRKAVRKAKATWMKHYADKCRRNNFNHAPKATWDIVRNMIKGFQGHFKNKAPKQFKNPEGITGTDDHANADTIQQYYQGVYSQQVNIDQSEINKLFQHQFNYELGDPPTYQEVSQAIKRTASEKSPGQTAITTDMLKNLPPEAFLFLTRIIQQYWTNPECDFTPWHIVLLSIIYKGKGDTKDPKNWRPVCLKETSAKILSSIVSKRLLKQIKIVGAPTQFGHVGCQEALHTIRNILTTRRHHGKETYVLFVDLVKAFDTVDHEVLFQILAKYGIPPALITVLKKMYRDCKIKFTIGKEERFINYLNGVYQGDNASAVLFLFLMLAATDSFADSFAHQNKAIYHYFPSNKNPDKQKGRLTRQPTQSKGNTVEVDNLLYVDDGAFVCTTMESLTNLTQALFTHLAKFGLRMHVGTAAEKSKSVAMHFPATLKETQEQNKNKKILPDIQLNSNTNLIHFAQEFKYLGSIISNDLKEDNEIKARIRKAWSVIGAMKFILRNKDVDLNTKIFLYTTAPLQALLWGAESWSLSKTNLNALNVFHHSAIRWILGIKMSEVRGKKIKNIEIRKKFGSLQDIDYYVKKRAWTYSGKIVRQQEDSLPKKLLGSWLQCPRKQGHPQKSSRSLYVAMLRSVIPDQISPEGKFNNFFNLAKDESIWEQKMEEYTNKLKSQMESETNENSNENNNDEPDENEEEE